MKVSTTELPPRQVSLEIEVEQERVDRAMDQAYQRIAGRVNVPGFRKGKAPRTMVERMVGRETIMEDALEHLVPLVVNEAIEQEKVEPYGRPQVQSIDVDPLRVTATIPLAPKVDLGEYQPSLRIDPIEVNVGDKEIDEVIDRLRTSYAQWVPVERPAQIGDRVSLDVNAVVDDTGRQIVDTKDAEYIVDPEGAEPAPGFANQVLGISTDEEKSFTLSLFEDDNDAEVAGKTATFTVKAHWVKEKQPPAVDDAFAQQAGDYADVAALRTAVESQLREREDERVAQERQDAALDKLVELAQIEVAPQVIQHQADHMYETFATNISRQGMPVDQYLQATGRDEAAFREEMKAQAEKRVHRSLALEAFAEAEKIEPSDEDLEAEIQRLIASSSNVETAEAQLKDPEVLARVKDSLRERVAMDRLIALATGLEPETPKLKGADEPDADTQPGTDAEAVAPTAAKE